MFAAPQWLEAIANDVASLWPIYLLVIAILGAARASTKVMTNAIHDVVKPVDSRLNRIESEFAPDGGFTMRDRQDHMMQKIDRIVDLVRHHDVALDVMWETADEAMYVVGTDGVTTKANQAYLELWGFRDEAQAKTFEWMQRLTPEGVALAESRMRAVFDPDGEHGPFTFDMELANGRVFRVLGRPIFNNSEWEGYAGVTFDLGAKTLQQVDDHVTDVDDHVREVDANLQEHVMWEERKYDNGGRKGQESDDAE